LTTEAISQFNDFLGYILDNLLNFLANLFQGWIIIITILTIGIIIALYFRFFRKIPLYSYETKP